MRIEICSTNYHGKADSMNTLLIWSIANHIESNIINPIDYNALESNTGFSYRTIRETFKDFTGKSLSKYILERRLAHCAYAIIHGKKSMTEIAYDYNFGSYDSFSRAFKRTHGIAPRAFKNQHIKVGRRRIMMGLYAPVVYSDEDSFYLKPYLMEVTNMSKTISNTEDSCILHGINRIAYSYEECTPFPMALKSYLNYLGQEMDYSYIMAVSGASFRLRWNTEYFDGGNVDICNIYADPYEAFKRSFKAVGKKYEIYRRADHTKESFKEIIRMEINEGRPVLAQGIIGPPEVCIITGYQDSGDTLLGWNVFQENTEFATGVTFHDSGYFITSSWWENPDTWSLMTLSEGTKDKIPNKEILANAINIMTLESLETEICSGGVNQMSGGQRAYDYWADWMVDKERFGDNLLIPQLVERYMCHVDAQTMVGEGRSYAAVFMESIGKENEALKPLCDKAAKLFRDTAGYSFKMADVIHGYEMNEENLKAFGQRAAREKITELIRKAKKIEAEALEVVKEIYEKM